MNFLYPAFLFGALAVAIPIALHFLRRDVAPEVPFSAVRLLQGSPIERSRRRRLRDLLLLAARVAALLLLAAAFARPYAPAVGASASGARIVAIDRSFSMGAPGQFDKALALAAQAIDEASSSERVAVVAFDDRAEVLAAPGSKADARAALSGLRAGQGGTRYGQLLAKAIEVADGSAGRIVIVSDLQRGGWEDERRAVMPAALTLDLRDAGAPPPNVAVTAVRIERQQVIATIRNTGPSREGVVRVTRDGAEVASARYAAAAGGTVHAAVPYAAPRAGALVVSVDDSSGAPADNARYVLLDAAAAPGVLVVTSAGTPQSGFYLTRALQASTDDEGDGTALAVRALTGAEASALPPEEFASHAAVVLLTTRGIDRRAREAIAALVRRGGGVLVAAAPEVEPDVLSTMFGWQPPLAGVEQPPSSVVLAGTDPRHPILRPFGALAANLGHVRFERAWRVKPEGWDVVGRFTDGSPALLERREAAGRVVLFASDLDRRWNDFPLHPVFVPFVVESVRYVAGAAAAGASELTVSTVPRGIPALAGIHPVEGRHRSVAVNVDTRESGGATLTPAEFDAMVDRISLEPGTRQHVRAQQTESRQSWWMYGLVLMLATLVVESFVGRAA